MNVFAEVGGNQQQIGGDCPEGWIVMTDARPDGEDTLDYVARSDGTWVIDSRIIRERSVRVEIDWQAAEMALIADQLIAIEDDDPSALPGTDRQWRDYRTKVRAWKDGAEHYPDSAFRPVQPG
ncbi:hypothetical protein [Pseudomonas abietaniphila]|uniref:Virus tail fibre assembly protein, lambda gpK n=1 Tax=Pseudomonas abietaniphila TaxID=89065 RepID=A0A1G8UTY0_9PSED|nr:hypothetical protein [Pseudomonas abietaniphila]SDJ57258.1 hypothetical protein SAMN05216605_1541 [Pseudomonas abietaniphila]